jgi:hypothetical protein
VKNADIWRNAWNVFRRRCDRRGQFNLAGLKDEIADSDPYFPEFLRENQWFSGSLDQARGGRDEWSSFV